MALFDKNLIDSPTCDRLLFRYDSMWGLIVCDLLRVACVSHACDGPVYSNTTECSVCHAEVPVGLTALRQLYNGRL